MAGPRNVVISHDDNWCGPVANGLLLLAGGRTLEDLRELEREDALLTLLGHDALPDPDTVGDWLRRMGDPETGQAGMPGVGLERVPCGETWANAVWFRLGVIAYNLVVGFTRLARPHAWARHTIATLRWKLLQVAGRIVRHAGQVVLKLVVEGERLALLRGIRHRCWALSGAT